MDCVLCERNREGRAGYRFYPERGDPEIIKPCPRCVSIITRKRAPQGDVDRAVVAKIREQITRERAFLKTAPTDAFKDCNFAPRKRRRG